MAKLKIYFDARHVSKKSGDAPLKVAVTHRSRNAYIELNIRLKPVQWDGTKVDKHPNKKALNDTIRRKMAEYQTILSKIEDTYDIDGLTANDIRDYLVEGINPDRIKPTVNTVKAVFAQFIEHKSGRTKGLYECTERKVRAFAGKSYDGLRFDDINVDWLHRFNEYLGRTAPSANARAIHMRNLRAVFNYAIDNEITTNYPFRRFKIKNEATRKRNFDVETLRTIFNATNLEPWQEKYRDLFKLTFMLIGINFVDLCGLQEVRGGRVDYIRAKTKKQYSIKIEPEIADIIAKYRGTTHLLNYLDTNKNYRSFYMNVCKGLRAIKEKLNELPGIEIDTLTTYWARHSWATIAARLDIPKETIAAALGHSGHTVTDIYIEFDRSKIDVANRRVLNWVLYGYEGGYAPEKAKKERSI